MSQRGTDWDQALQDIRAIWDAFNRGDYTAMLRWVHPEVELQDYPRVPDATWHRGYEGAAQWTAKILEVLDRPQVHLGELVPVDGNRVAIDAVFSGTGKRGGARAEITVGALVTMRDGLVQRMALYRSKDAALEAAGLSE